MGPKDAVAQYAIPVNTETGRPLTEKQLHRLEALKEAAELLYDAMHNADGSATPGEHQGHVFTGHRMQRAAEYVEMGVMLARKAALE